MVSFFAGFVVLFVFGGRGRAQLDDLVSSYGFPRAIAPDRTPTLSAAMAGARGVLPACLRRVIAASNHLALTEFPGKVAAASAAGR